MVQTIDLKGNKYATVPQRLKEFREKNPRASIATKPTITDGIVMFEAKIKTDIKNTDSAEATGHSYGKLGEAKAFEKQETIAVGRALVLLGYLNNGQVATTEEMEEFEEYRIGQVKEAIANAEKREDFQKILKELSPELKKEVTPIINKRIEELANGKSS